MEYDAQTADWVCIGTLSQDELNKRSANKQAVQDTKANVTQTKGKNFGLGTMDAGAVAGLMTAATDSASIASNSGNDSAAAMASELTENLALVPDAMKAASLAKTMSKEVGSVVKQAPPAPSLPSAPSPVAPIMKPPVRKEKKKSAFSSFFSSSSSNAAEEAMAKASEEAWVTRAAQDSAKIKELEQRVELLERDRSRMDALEAQIKKLMSNN